MLSGLKIFNFVCCMHHYFFTGISQICREILSLSYRNEYMPFIYDKKQREDQNKKKRLCFLYSPSHKSQSGLRAVRSPQTGHITLSSTSYRQLENQSTKYHRQQSPV
jgi:hypothetical protein